MPRVSASYSSQSRRFTRAARELARRRRVVLVDGQRLESWFADGVSPLPDDPLDD